MTENASNPEGTAPEVTAWEIVDDGQGGKTVELVSERRIGMFWPDRRGSSAMFRCLSLQANLRRILVGAVAVVGVAMGAILASQAPASVRDPAASVLDPRVGSLRDPAAPVLDPSRCRWVPYSASFVWGDPTAWYPSIGGYYKQAPKVAYKITGEFPHATTLTFTAYDDYGFVPLPANELNDHQMVPDPGSVNPFLVGERVNAPNRSYTAWLWPDSEPVPAGLHNVIPFPTEPADPTDEDIRFQMIMRMYEMQPGYNAPEAIARTAIHAVSTSNPDKRVRCPLTFGSQIRSALDSFGSWADDLGPAQQPPMNPGNRILFMRTPALFVPYPEGYSTDGAVNYLSARLDLSRISVVTWHRVPTHFNNQMLPAFPVMGDYQARYMSQVVLHFPEYRAISVNSNNAIYQPDGSWVTVYLPSQPRLRPRQLRAVRARATQLGYNVIQLPRPNLLSRVVPEQLAVRMKVPNPTFCCSVGAVPSWVDPNNPATAGNNYRDWDQPKDAAFFNTYTSNSTNMGPYYIDGVKETFAEFMQR